MTDDVPQVPRGREPVGPRTERMLPIIDRAIRNRLDNADGQDDQ